MFRVLGGASKAKTLLGGEKKRNTRNIYYLYLFLHVIGKFV